jgi:GTP cyclohydrolase II
MNNPSIDLYVLLGPPGAGKSTQAEKIADVLGLAHLSWGRIIRARKIKAEDRQPGLATTLMLEKLATHIHKRQETAGIIIEGYPHNTDEAVELLKFVQSHHIILKAVIRLNYSLDYLIRLQAERKICSVCGRDYLQSRYTQCPFDGNILSHLAVQNDEIKSEFYNHAMSAKEIVKILAPIAKSSFSIDGDQKIPLVTAQILEGIFEEKRLTQIFEPVASTLLETKYGTFTLSAYQSKIDYTYHLALIKGIVANQRAVPVRIHSSCITGDILGSRHCECGEQLDAALLYLAKRDNGILLYLFQEGRGINIINKIKAYQLQSQGLDTVEANEALGLPSEMRSYEAARDILNDLQVTSISLLSNNPHKMFHLRAQGVVIEDAIPLEIKPNKTNRRYLETKQNKMNHTLHLKG